jgi:hypothetical protein
MLRSRDVELRRADGGRFGYGQKVSLLAEEASQVSWCS